MRGPLRCLVVEDEVEARASLVALVASCSGLDLVGTAADGVEATARLDRDRPDLVFLDIRLPERDGLDALRLARHRPEVIFTTAHEAHALAAFELGAVDYLVKPFGRERFERAVQRLLARSPERQETPDVAERLREGLAAPVERLFARKGGVIVPLPVAQVIRLEAQAEYVCIHSERGKYLMRIPLRELIARLDPRRFEVVHRSHVVNLDHVVEMVTVDDRRLELRMANGSTVVASRSASERLRGLAR
jgi:two-component system LytT family response regulator